MKYLVLMLLLLSSVSTGLAQDAKPGETDHLVNKQRAAQVKGVRDLYRSWQNDANDKRLITRDTDLYLDLAREIDMTQKERERDSEFNAANIELENRLGELLGELKILKADVGKAIVEKEEKNDNLKLVQQLYESLSPDQSAQLMEKMPKVVVIKLMQMMPVKKSSKILAAMKPSIAVELSQALIKAPLFSRTAQN